MRAPALIACTSIILTIFAFVPTAEARMVDCTNGVAGCCDVCPPPPPAAVVCKELVVGGTPVAVTVGYGLSAECAELILTTCHLSYYPGEPNTPVGVCTDKTILA